MANDSLYSEVEDSAEILIDPTVSDSAAFADEATPASIERAAASLSATGVSAEEVARAAAQAAYDKKAEDIVVIDLTEFSDVCDYFMIATGMNARQVDTIIDEIEEKVADAYGEHPFSIEGRDQRSWILMDYGSVVVHVFTPEARDYYRLEKLWGDAPTLDLTLVWPPLLASLWGRVRLCRFRHKRTRPQSVVFGTDVPVPKVTRLSAGCRGGVGLQAVSWGGK